MVARAMGTPRAGRHAFYVGMAGLFVLMAFGGFFPTYWARITAPGFHANPIVHIHGALDKNYIYVVDTATGRIVDTWYGVMGNHGTELSPDGKHLYVGNFFTRVIYAYDTATGEVDKFYRARESIRPFKIDRDEKRIYYQLSNFHGFEVQDLQSGKILQVVDLPKLTPDQHADANGTVDHGLAITPDGTKLLAAGSVAGYVAIYSLPDLKLLGTVAVGKAPNWIRVRADSKIAFTGNPGSNDVSVIDIGQMKEIKRIPAGQRPARFDIVDVR